VILPASRSAANVPAEVLEIADGVAAYLQPDGSWGLANSGLIVGETDCLLVDTLFDLAHTQRMLEAFRRFCRRGDDASIVVNTHANGDHCYGNFLLKGRRIIATSSAVREMHEMRPGKLASLMRAARFATALGPLRPSLGRTLKRFGLRLGSDLLDAAPYVLSAFSRFAFRGIESVLPSETFDGQLELDLGGKRVLLLELGPAHTAGDLVVYLPENKTLFAGDLLFEGMHPLVWVGTISSYLLALERLLGLDLDVVVPGHGRATDRAGIVRHVEYLRALRDEVEPLCRDGLTPEQVASTLIRKGFGSLREPERLVVNVAAAYREFGADGGTSEVIPLFAAMARLANGQ
jgi:cyclase